MSGAAGFENPHNNGQKKSGLTLVNLLNEEQPYRHLNRLNDPEVKISDDDRNHEKIRRIQGSLVGLAIGDAVGAPVEFRPNAYLKENEVKDMQSGGTWGLEKGQWTDDTSMALCLAASLIVKGEFNAYDQFLRYRKWYRDGYMSSTGKCFDIGKSTRDAITVFEKRWQDARARINSQNKKLNDHELEKMVGEDMYKGKNELKLGTSDSAGNGPLMRLAPIPCFFTDSYEAVLQHIDEATELTHGDPRAIDACRFYAGLIWHALNGERKEQLLDRNFYRTTLKLKLHDDVREIAEGSYKDKKKGYEDGIRGKGYIVNSLEAALWAFANDEDKFDKGVLLAVNLGDDTDTTAAIYGELAGAVYGIDKIRQEWIDQLFQGEFIKTIAKGLYIKGEKSRRTPQESDRSGETNKTRDGSKASGPSKKQHNQRSGGTDNTSDPSQNTDKDGTSDTAYSGGKSNTNDPSSNGGRRYVFSE